MIQRLLVVILLLTAVNATAQIDISQTDGVSIAISSQVTPIPLNQMHSWVITLHTADDKPMENATILVQGGMPEHDHGLATSPQVTDYLGDGQYLIEGLRFHMPGDWLMEIQISHLGRIYRSEAKFQLGTQPMRPSRNTSN